MATKDRKLAFITAPASLENLAAGVANAHTLITIAADKLVVIGASTANNGSAVPAVVFSEEKAKNGLAAKALGLQVVGHPQSHATFTLNLDFSFL